MKNNLDRGLFSGFILKIFGLLFMTLDHIGVFLCSNEYSSSIGTVFRMFGRLALPIFIFLLVKGVKHTKNELKYFLRILVLALVFVAGQIFVFYFYNRRDFASPIIDLLVVLVTLLLLKRKDKFSLLSLIPILFSVASFIIENLQKYTGIPEYFIPFYLKLSYPLYSLLLGLGFYYSKSIASFILRQNTSTEALTESSYLSKAETIVSAVILILTTLLFYLTYILFNISYSPFSYQIYALFSSIFIIFYSGKRGYNKKWFQYGCYLYAPLHIVIIFLIFNLL